MKVAIIGQGYVGQTIAYNAALNGHHVIGLDTDNQLIKDLNKAITLIPGIDSLKLEGLIKSKYYLPTTNPRPLSDCEVIVIAVPTPLDSNSQPDLKYLHSAVEVISNNICPDGGVLIVNESTSYPGTLRNIVMPLITKKSKHKIFFASSPERVDPGNSNWNMKNTPRLVSGIDNESTEKAFEFYSSFCDVIYRVSSPEVAEAGKIFENTFRQVNIALANEFSEVAHKIGFSATEAIAAASTKPFGFMPFFPSIGVGGHCIPIDPTYLSHIADLYGVKTEFINLANKVNLEMAFKVIQRIETFLEDTVQGKKIQVAGITYKPNVADLREAPALKLIKLLKKQGAIVSWHDPIINKYGNLKSEPLSDEIDLGLIVTPHDIIDFSLWKRMKTRVLDLSPGTKSYGWPKFL